MKINFHTNLDEMKPYVDNLTYRNELKIVPHIGESIEFKLAHNWYQRMQVIDVTYTSDGYMVNVELHLGKHWRGTLLEWMDRFRDRKYSNSNA